MEIFVIVLLIALNGVLALSEIAIVSAKKVRLQKWAEKGNARAHFALRLSEDPGAFLSTIQVGITAVGVLAGAYGEAALSEPLAEGLANYPAVAAYSEALAFGIVVVLITYFSLVFGELVPKRLALLNPETLSVLIAPLMKSLSLIAYPIVRILSASTEGVLRLLGAKPSEQPPVTEEEIKVLMQQGLEAGVFKPTEAELVRNVFHLDQRGIGALMTPRPDLVFLDLDASWEANRDKILASPHAIFPTCRENLDQIAGIVRGKRLLEQCLSGESVSLESLLEPPLYVPETLSGVELLKTFKRSPLHSALVIDEYGEIQGIVTLNDVLETIVGEVSSIASGEEPMATQREDGSWLLDGMIPIDEFREVVGLAHWPAEDRGSYNTLAGFVMARLGRVPQVADAFEWQNFRLEVVDMDRTRVDKILVRPVTRKKWRKEEPSPD